MVSYRWAACGLLASLVSHVLLPSFAAGAERCEESKKTADDGFEVVEFPCFIGDEKSGTQLLLVSLVGGGGHKEIFELEGGRALALERKGRQGGKRYIEKEVGEMKMLRDRGLPMIDFEASVTMGPCFTRHPTLERPKRLMLDTPGEDCQGYVMKLYPQPRFVAVKEHGGYRVRESVLRQIRAREDGSAILTSFVRNLGRMLAQINEHRLDLFDLQFFLDTHSGDVLIFDTSLKRTQTAEKDPLKWYEGRFEVFEHYLEAVDSVLGPPAAP